jgi:hypothetical protein
MMKKLLVILTVITLSISACSVLPVGLNTIKGSGNVTSETRDVSGFTGINLAGSANVDVTLGEPEAVVVEAEDNIAPLIETRVENNQLVISLKPKTNIATTKPVRVHVTMKSLDKITLGGSGGVTSSNLNGDAIQVDLPGSGNIQLSGTVKSAIITLSGSGRVTCDQLKASSVRVKVSGSGNARVYASDSLEAGVSGSGSIRYSGNPAQINKNVTGSGSIISE